MAKQVERWESKSGREFAGAEAARKAKQQDVFDDCQEIVNIVGYAYPEPLLTLEQLGPLRTSLQALIIHLGDLLPEADS